MILEYLLINKSFYDFLPSTFIFFIIKTAETFFYFNCSRDYEAACSNLVVDGAYGCSLGHRSVLGMKQVRCFSLISHYMYFNCYPE